MKGIHSAFTLNHLVCLSLHPYIEEIGDGYGPVTKVAIYPPYKRTSQTELSVVIEFSSAVYQLDVKVRARRCKKDSPWA